jgi:hypothetical protein
MENLQKKMKGIVLNTVLELLEKDNKITALQLKDILAEKYPKSNWESIFVSEWLIEFVLKGVISYKICLDPLCRIYYNPTKECSYKPNVDKPSKTTKSTKTKKDKWSTSARISKTKALGMMMNNKGRFFSVQFVKKADKTLRTMNCQYLPGQVVNLGVVKVKEACLVRSKDPNPIRSFDLHTLKKVSIGGQVYNVK